MSSKGCQRKRYKTPERASLVTESVLMLDAWIEQLNERTPQLKLSRSDLVNWLLRRHSSILSEKEMTAIERDYFDPVKALEIAIAEVKKQQGQGERIDIEKLLNEKVLRKRRSGKRGNAKSVNSATSMARAANVHPTDN